jgi:hypothetical protein
MKSQRRHDLQTNSLAKALSQAPGFFRKHGAKVFLAIIVVGLLIIVLRQRSNLAQQEMNVGWSNVTVAREAIDQLAQSSHMGMGSEAEFNFRGKQVEMVSTAGKTAEGSDHRPLAAAGLVVRGQLNWTLANLPEIEGAATRPSLKMEQTSAEYLERAEDAYRRVVKDYGDVTASEAAARFGLAACAENRRDWAAAREQYEAVMADKRLSPTFGPMAEFRLKALAKIKDPLYVAPATQPAAEPVTQPAGRETQPAALGPVFTPTTQP